MRALGTVVTVAGLLVPSGPPAPAPAIGVAPGPLLPGAPVEVTLANFPPGIVNLEVCGGAARRGSADCAVGDARSVVVGGDGPIRVELRVAAPPSPCPCVLRAIGAGGSTALLPVRIVGVPDVAPASPRPARPVVAVTSVHPGVTDWSLLAGPTRVRVRAVVANRGGRRAEATSLNVALARTGAAPLVTRTVRTPPVPAGASRSVEVHLPVPAPAWGTYTVTAALASGSTARSRVEVTPWGVPALLGAAVVVLTVALWRRRSVATRAPSPAPPSSPAVSSPCS